MMLSHQARRLLSTQRRKHYDKIVSTMAWFERIVVGEKLCPFAVPLTKHPERLRVVDCSQKEDACEFVKKEVTAVCDPDQAHETTLVVFDDSFKPQFREFVHFSWQLQEKAIGEDYVEKVQMVLFHPEAVHQTYSDFHPTEGLPGDYTIRSPFPTVHLLRHDDVAATVQRGNPELEHLPMLNRDKMQILGFDECKKRLERCYKPSKKQRRNVWGDDV